MQEAEYFDLGDHSFPVTTSSAEAQLWFDRGLRWVYGFNQDEAVVCFRRAAAYDPACAMAYWGEAYASGPFYNMVWEQFSDHELNEAVGVCFRAAQEAVTRCAHVPPVEKALVDALAQRFQAGTPPSLEVLDGWEEAYACAMRNVYTRFPGHIDVIALSAEALMTRTPWKLWNLATGEPADGSYTLEAIDMLQSGLNLTDSTGEKPHIGVLHLCIHAYEMSPTPEKALPWADTLRDQSPDNGHLQHMPAHIYVICGHYHDAISASHQAIAADTMYLEHAGLFNFYSLNRGHDLHMLLHASMMSGRLGDSLLASSMLVDVLPEALLRIDKPYLAMILEGYRSNTWHALVRFGLWQQILDTPLPDDPDLYVIGTAMGHYARGVAFSATGQLEAAHAEVERLREAMLAMPAEKVIGNNPASDVLAIARQMLEGELKFRKREYDEAFSCLRAAVSLNDSLSFSEPWPWMHPPRHALGALLLERGAVEEATAVYRADLGLDTTLPRACANPDNVWSLHGLVECLKRDDSSGELVLLKQRLALALSRADVSIRASCCCRGIG